MKILDRFNGKIIIEDEDKSIKALVGSAVKNNINLTRANLTWADLTEANLRGANLTRADLTRANLTEADLTWADLTGADLTGAILTRADLTVANLTRANLTEAILARADLTGANLTEANLTRANLTEANLTWAGLTGANLTGANLTEAILTWANLTWANNIEFQQFPSIRTLSFIRLNNISNETILELMRLDADAHPHPELFNEWAKGGRCPYQNEERWWYKPEKREVWKPGKPTMALRDLIIQICREEKWGIKDILPLKDI